jgi:hypothetical protein
MPLSQIEKFEWLNEVSVNVLAYLGDRQIEPVFMTSRRYQLHVNLLLISDDAGRHHFCLVRNMSRLMRDGLLRDGLMPNKRRRANICNYCLQAFKWEKALVKHVGVCRGSTVQQAKAKKRRTELAEAATATAATAAASAAAEQEDARAGTAVKRRREQQQQQQQPHQTPCSKRGENGF